MFPPSFRLFPSLVRSQPDLFFRAECQAPTRFAQLGAQRSLWRKGSFYTPSSSSLDFFLFTSLLSPQKVPVFCLSPNSVSFFYCSTFSVSPLWLLPNILFFFFNCVFPKISSQPFFQQNSPHSPHSEILFTFRQILLLLNIKKEQF